VFSVARISNLLYRTASSLHDFQMLELLWKSSEALPIGNRRYSRLETCATFCCSAAIQVVDHDDLSYTPPDSDT
jgi:hypothetical protein